MRVDVRIDGELAAIPGVVRRLAAAGAAGVFTYEGPRDVFLPLAVAASAGTGLDLYTNLAIALPRSPMHLAYTAWDLQRASGGRFLLGLGSQVKAHVERRYGATWEQPVEQLREWVLALRAIFARWTDGVPLAFEGRWTQHTLMPPLFDPGPVVGGPPPVLLGAVGPRMTRMATEVADGILVHPFATGRSLAELTLPAIEAGLAGAGRARADFTVIGQGIVAVGRTEEELAIALAGARGLVAFYASTPAYRVVLDVHGWGGLQPMLQALTRAGRWGDLPGAVPDEVVRTLAMVGGPAEVADQLRSRYAAFDRVALSIPYTVDPDTLEALLAATSG